MSNLYRASEDVLAESHNQRTVIFESTSIRAREIISILDPYKGIILRVESAK